MPPAPFVTEVKYREFFPFNFDGAVAIFESDVYLLHGIITCHIPYLPVIIILE
jgi:hypothetical protein